MCDVMCDLETWGTRPGASLRSIGAVVFYWTTTKPAESVTASTPLRDTAPAAQPVVNAYSVTDPVSADTDSAPGPGTASNEGVRSPRNRDTPTLSLSPFCARAACAPKEMPSAALPARTASAATAATYLRRSFICCMSWKQIPFGSRGARAEGHRLLPPL